MAYFSSFFESLETPLLFHSGYFLAIFACFLIGYAFVSNRLSIRNLYLIAFGFFFYYKSSGGFLLLLLLSISGDYLFSLAINRSKNPMAKKLYLFTGIVFSLTPLMYFKYRYFFLENLCGFLQEPFTVSQMVLPVGISFYTFQSISYLVDTYNGEVKPTNFRDYLLYMTFFPHLVAGPIVRAKDFMPQVLQPTKLDMNSVQQALFLICKGLVKKAVIADYVGQYADLVFADPSGFSGTELLLGVLCYTLQIFGDFSGYTDMAIGIAALLGFHLCKNFDSPYKANNITDFWRRWHISLSSWLRDYIYIPLGGNKKGLNMQLCFLMLTMLIGGFWHGASWKFVFWGAGHGLLLVIHKLWTKYASKNFKESSLWSALSWMLTFSCVALLWIPFRATNMEDVWMMYQKIFTGQDFNYWVALYQANTLVIILLILGFSLTLLPASYKEALKMQYLPMSLTMKFITMAIVIQAIIQLRSEAVQAFIYFQF